VKNWKELHVQGKPRGSGYFAMGWGVVFFLLIIGSFFVRVDELSPDWIMRVWFLLVGVILILWGINRVKTGRDDRTIGQNTINLVIGIVGATIALLALLNDAK
jgi:hypothetical protein